MKKIIIGAALAAGMAIPAFAADLPARMPAKAPIIAAPVAYNWSGFYVGLHVGGVFGDNDWTLTDIGGFPVAGVSGSHDVSGILAGGQVGFNIQSGQFVFGVEAQGSWTESDGDFGCAAFTCRSEVGWLATVAGRVGIAWDRLLVYVKGGAAFADHDHLVEGPIGLVVVSSSHGKTRTGWMAGAGLEFALGGNFSGKIEYNYMDFGSESFTFGVPGVATATVDVDSQLHVVKAGINYRFGGAGPVMARY